MGRARPAPFGQAGCRPGWALSFEFQAGLVWLASLATPVWTSSDQVPNKRLILLAFFAGQVGTLICVPQKDFIDIDRIASIENNHEPIDIAKNGQKVTVKVYPTTFDVILNAYICLVEIVAQETTFLSDQIFIFLFFWV
ncbi:Translation protein, beta-barrel domain containing protein, partial [Trema orientale]